MIDPVIAKIIQRCAKSPSFFIDNFCRVKHPKLGIIPFKLFSYQKRCLKEFRNHRFTIFRKCRQCGISTLTGGYALWYAMFKNNQTILIVSKRDDDAKEYLGRNVKFAYNNLPQWMKDLWKPEIINEHTLGFANGSVIRSLTSSPDTLRSNASSLNIIDEAAFIDKMEDMWAGGYSCVRPETVISYDGVLSQIGDLGNVGGAQWQDIDVAIQSDKGIERSDRFYVNGVADTNIITTSLGYEIECTDNHRLKDKNYSWVYTRDINVGQKLALKCGSDFDSNFDTHLVGDAQHCQAFIQAKNANTVSAICNHCGNLDNLNYRAYKRNWTRNKGKFICRKCGPMLKMGHDFVKPKILKDGLAEVIGYYVGDGSLAAGRGSRLRLCYDPQDQDLYEHFAEYFRSIGLNPLQHNANGAKEVRVDNSRFIKWFIKNGFKSKTSARDAEVPSVILKSSVKIRRAFLRGLFEADGWLYNYKNACRPTSRQWSLGFSSVSKKLAKQVQSLLLDSGIIARLSKSKGGYENSSNSWRLEIINMDHMMRFMLLIGFISKRKNITIAKKTSMGPIKYIINNNGIFYDEIVSKTSSRSMTVDISVPTNNTYIANGFVSHNTLQHGGNVIVVSTPKGVGNWYWKTWADAVDKSNDFNPIIIDWWDMDWKLKFADDISGITTTIAPTNGIVELDDPKDIEKYGPGPYGKTYWSPWLEGEYRNLATKGDDSKFRQEVLAEFIGSGNTVLNRLALSAINSTVDDKWTTFKEPVPYINPSVGEHTFLDFQELLWIWNKPYTQEDASKVVTKANLKEIPLEDISYPDRIPHIYVLGADPSSGEAEDYCGIQVFDIITQEQVAELRIKALPKTFAKMIDYIGRWYNNALVVCERTGIGQAVCQELDRDLMYPNLYRHSRQAANLKTKYSQIGYPTSRTTKPMLIKYLIDNVGQDGYLIKSSRLYHEFCIFIHLGNNRYGNEPGVGNTDDVAMATCLSLAGIHDALMRDNRNLIPLHNTDMGPEMATSVADSFGKLPGRVSKGLMIPFGSTSEMYTGKPSKTEELAKFTTQLGGLPLNKNPGMPSRKTDSVTAKKHILRYFRG